MIGPLAARTAIGVIASATFASLGNAQLDTTRVGVAKLLQAGFAVPDAPALKMLDGDASKLLRPVSVKALTAALSNASGEFSYIPRALFVEFSPFMLTNGERLTLQEYRRSLRKYRTRLSFAAKRDTGANARSEVAAAVRFVLDDASDFRTNRTVLATIQAVTRRQVDSSERVDSVLIARGISLIAERRTPEQNAEKAEVEKRLAVEHAQAMQGLVSAAKRAQEDALWNASVFDLAFGIRGSAVDSTGSGMQFDGVAGWLTRGWALGHGRQLLLGAHAAYERDFSDTTTTDLKGTGDIALRLYAGSNRYKALGEIQATARASTDPKVLGKIGGELQLAESIWIEASLGYQSEGSSEGKVVSSFKLKFTPSSG